MVSGTQSRAEWGSHSIVRHMMSGTQSRAERGSHSIVRHMWVGLTKVHIPLYAIWCLKHRVELREVCILLYHHWNQEQGWVRLHSIVCHVVSETQSRAEQHFYSIVCHLVYIEHRAMLWKCKTRRQMKYLAKTNIRLLIQVWSRVQM